MKKRGIVTVVSLGMLLAGCSSSSSGGDEKDEGPDEFDAQVMCEQFVEDQLKAPATADFSDQRATSTGAKTWEVTGSVDAENSFGAKIRNTYTCDLKYLGNDRWRARSVDLGE